MARPTVRLSSARMESPVTNKAQFSAQAEHLYENGVFAGIYT